jgi:uncharacterized protein (UPF0548 family)
VTRRSNHRQNAASYGAVGASSDPNLVRFPPEGFSGFYDEVLIGMGQARFREAADELLSWEAQQRVGIRVTDVQPGEETVYSGLQTDEDGNALGMIGSDEVTFSATGDELLTSGTTAVLKCPFFRRGKRIRVMYTLSETRRVGFAMGTIDERGVIGEILFSVEHRPDRTVWAAAQGFVAAADPGWLGVKQHAARPFARLITRLQLKTLTPGRAPSKKRT